MLKSNVACISWYGFGSFLFVDKFNTKVTKRIYTNYDCINFMVCFFSLFSFPKDWMSGLVAVGLVFFLDSLHSLISKWSCLILLSGVVTFEVYSYLTVKSRN